VKADVVLAAVAIIAAKKSRVVVEEEGIVSNGWISYCGALLCYYCAERISWIKKCVSAECVTVTVAKIMFDFCYATLCLFSQYSGTMIKLAMRWAMVSK
jgi:hypothetical protein